MNENIAVNKKDLYSLIEKTISRIDNDERYRKELEIKYLPRLKKRKTQKNKKYQLVAYEIQNEYGHELISPTTIWRLLEIKKEEPSIYKKVVEGKLSVRNAYDNVFGKENKKPCQATDVDNYNFSTEPDPKKLTELLAMSREQLTEWKTKLNNYNERDYKNLDEECFKLRKTIGSIISRNMADDYDKNI